MYYDVPCLHYFEVDLATIFSEPDGEEMTYTAALHSSVSAWLTIDNTTNKIYGTPTQVNDVNRAFYLYAHDPKFDDTSVYIYLRIRRNDPPTRDTSVPTLICYEDVL